MVKINHRKLLVDKKSFQPHIEVTVALSFPLAPLQESASPEEIAEFHKLLGESITTAIKEYKEPKHYDGG